jgi:hypothetical protein
VLQDDDPYLKRTDAGGTAMITSMNLSIPRHLPVNPVGTAVGAAQAFKAHAAGTGAIAAEFALVNSGDSGQHITAVSLDVDHPEFLTALKLTVTDGVAGTQSVSLLSVSATGNLFTLADTLQLRPGGRLNFTLQADVAAVIASRGPSVIASAYAGTGGASEVRLGAAAGGLMLLVLAMLSRRYRRAALVAAFVGLWLVGCGGGGDNASTPKLPTANFTLNSVTATTDSGGTPSYAAGQKVGALAID